MSKGVYLRTEYHRQITSNAMRGLPHLLGENNVMNRPEVKEKNHTQESREKRSKTMRILGIVPPSNKGIPMSEAQKEKVSIAHQKRWDGKPRTEKRTSYHLTDYPYKKWRREVFERDNYTCRVCGERGGHLIGDHIRRWAEYPELRYEITNGKTLCVSCHKLTPTYGNRKV